MRTLVLYVFHEYNNRVEYFINNAIFKDEDIDFRIICNDPNLQFNVPPYVKVLFRENIGYDFGAWSYGLLHDETYKSYDNFIFVNSSVSGPYNTKGGRWTDIYINGLTDDIRLYGSTINTLYQSYTRFLYELDNCISPTVSCFIYPLFNEYAMKRENNVLYFSHIQSYIYAMTRETLEYLISREIFSLKNIALTFNEAIINKEILMSREILNNNWNIGCLMSQYKGIDFRVIYKNPPECVANCPEDVMFSSYIGKYINPEELVFIKGNR